MIELLPAVVGSSLLGSLHCLAMCGPLIGLHGGARSMRLALCHALGRLVTYVALGAMAGAVGRAVDLAGQLAQVQRAAAVVAAIAIGAWALHAIAVAAGMRRLRVGGGAFRATLVKLRTKRPPVRAMLTGALTGLLPCGWLWAFVIAAAGTASVLGGALTMAAFWLGTVPAMTGLLALGGPVIGALQRRMPVVTAVVLLAVGLGTLAMRWDDAGATGVTQPRCHDPAATHAHGGPR